MTKKIPSDPQLEQSIIDALQAKMARPNGGSFRDVFCFYLISYKGMELSEATKEEITQMMIDRLAHFGERIGPSHLQIVEPGAHSNLNLEAVKPSGRRYDLPLGDQDTFAQIASDLSAEQQQRMINELFQDSYVDALIEKTDFRNPENLKTSSFFAKLLFKLLAKVVKDDSVILQGVMSISKMSWIDDGKYYTDLSEQEKESRIKFKVVVKK